MTTSASLLDWTTRVNWGITDEVLSYFYAPDVFQGEIFPMTILRPSDAVPEDSNKAVLYPAASMNDADPFELVAVQVPSIAETKYGSPLAPGNSSRIEDSSPRISRNLQWQRHTLIHESKPARAFP